jgi:hypothetical protein
LAKAVPFYKGPQQQHFDGVLTRGVLGTKNFALASGKIPQSAQGIPDRLSGTIRAAINSRIYPGTNSK